MTPSEKNVCDHKVDCAQASFIYLWSRLMPLLLFQQNIRIFLAWNKWKKGLDLGDLKLNKRRDQL